MIKWRRLGAGEAGRRSGEEAKGWRSPPTDEFDVALDGFRRVSEAPGQRRPDFSVAVF